MLVDRRPRFRRPATLVVIGLIGAVVGGGCTRVEPSPAPSLAPSAIAQAPTPDGGASMSPSSPEITDSPPATSSPAPTTQPPAPSTQIAIDTAARTATDRLRVRSAPGVGATSVKLEPLLPTGTLLFVIDGPVTADGYDWYHAMPFDGIAPTGWVAAAAHDGTPWLAPESLTCPTPPLDTQAILDLSSFGGLICFGNREIQLVGDVTCELGDDGIVFAGPTWIRHDRRCSIDLGGETRSFFDGGIEGLGLPTHGRAVVTGHFDDPEARSCVWDGVDGPSPDPATIVASCRAMFVTTALN
jgi:hypothetical protein